MPRPALAVASVAAVAVALIPLVYLAVRTGEAGWSAIAEELFTRRVAVLTGRSLALAAVVTAGLRRARAWVRRSW